MKRIDNNYLNKLQLIKKTAVIAIINGTNLNHTDFLNTIFLKKAIKENKKENVFSKENNGNKTGLVFTYMNLNSDKNLLDMFKIDKTSSLSKPKVVVYNFETYKYYIGELLYDDKMRQKKSFNNLIIAIERKTLKMIKGNLVDDWFDTLGIELSSFSVNMTFLVIIILIPTLLLLMAGAYLFMPERKKVHQIKLENVRQRLIEERLAEESKDNKENEDNSTNNSSVK